MQVHDRAGFDLQCEIEIGGLDDVRAENANGVDRPANGLRMQASQDCFNFRKFRHLKLSATAARLWIVPGSWDRNKRDKQATIGKRREVRSWNHNWVNRGWASCSLSPAIWGPKSLRRCKSSRQATWG